MEYRNNYEYIGIIELENGNYYHVVKYATDNGFNLEAGTATNTCFLSSYRIECDNNDNIDVTLSELYERIIEGQQESQDINNLLEEY